VKRNLLSNLLTPISAQLRGARRHDGVGRGDVCLFASARHLLLANCSYDCLNIQNPGRDGGNNVLALLKLRLQDLAMILHAFDIDLGVRIRRLLRSGGVDVSVGEDVGRHVD
jgi:hypothetical protein